MKIAIAVLIAVLVFGSGAEAFAGPPSARKLVARLTDGNDHRVANNEVVGLLVARGGDFSDLYSGALILRVARRKPIDAVSPMVQNGWVMARRKLGLPALAVFGAALLLSSPAFAEEKPAGLWIDDLDAALATARETGRPVLVYVLDSI